MASALATYTPFDKEAGLGEQLILKQRPPPGYDQQPHNSRVRMMYWTMKNDELAKGDLERAVTCRDCEPQDHAQLPQAGGADEGGIVFGREHRRHELLRRSDDESGEESLTAGLVEDLNKKNHHNHHQHHHQPSRHHQGPQVLVVPSLHPCGPTASMLDYIAGLRYYEERQLYHIFLLRKRDPSFRVIFVSSVDIPREVIAYYFRLMRSTGRCERHPFVFFTSLVQYFIYIFLFVSFFPSAISLHLILVLVARAALRMKMRRAGGSGWCCCLCATRRPRR
jgi:hypothetical protein